LAYVDACYQQALEDEEDAAAFDAYYLQAMEDELLSDAEIAATVVQRRTANLPVVSLVDLDPGTVTDAQLAQSRKYVYTSTQGLTVGMTSLVTPKRLAQPEIATWMTLEEGPERQDSKEELMAFKQALARRQENKTIAEKSDQERERKAKERERKARGHVVDVSWM